MQKLFIFITFLLFILQCNLKIQDNNNLSIVKQKKEFSKIEEAKVQYTLSEQWNELKNFVYGNENILNPELKQYQKSSWYLQSIKNIKEMENKLDDRKIKIVNWHAKYLKETYRIKTAVYLLSGADLFHLMLFYPQAENYVMIALEDTGEIADQYNEQELQYGLYSTQNIISNLTKSGYLFSKTMMQFLFKNKHSRFSGVLPVLLYFTAYFKYDIIDITPMCLNNENQSCIFKGLQFKIIDSKQNLKNIYYFNKKLQPEDFKNNSLLDNFLNNYTDKGLFLKAAVYLFHYEKYLKVNEYLTQQFNIIVQDDSGIPYRYIKMMNYNIKLFGKYKDATDIKSTINPFQKDLFIDYQKNALELPFEFGYAQARKSNLSNLIYAYK